MSWQKVVAGIIFFAGYMICTNRLGRWEAFGIFLMILGPLIFTVGWKRVVKGEDQMRERI
jgi:hypothetical protein